MNDLTREQAAKLVGVTVDQFNACFLDADLIELGCKLDATGEIRIPGSVISLLANFVAVLRGAP